MSRDFARLFCILTTIEREYGLTSLDKGERAIFDFIVSFIANGREPCTDDIVNAKLTSRASTYRWIASLKQAGLIESRLHQGATVFTVAPKFEKFKRSLKGVTRAL